MSGGETQSEGEAAELGLPAVLAAEEDVRRPDAPVDQPLPHRHVLQGVWKCS